MKNNSYKKDKKNIDITTIIKSAKIIAKEYNFKVKETDILIEVFKTEDSPQRIVINTIDNTIERVYISDDKSIAIINYKNIEEFTEYLNTFIQEIIDEYPYTILTEKEVIEAAKEIAVLNNFIVNIETYKYGCDISITNKKYKAWINIQCNKKINDKLDILDTYNYYIILRHIKKGILFSEEFTDIKTLKEKLSFYIQEIESNSPSLSDEIKDEIKNIDKSIEKNKEDLINKDEINLSDSDQSPKSEIKKAISLLNEICLINGYIVEKKEIPTLDQSEIKKAISLLNEICLINGYIVEKKEIPTLDQIKSIQKVLVNMHNEIDTAIKNNDFDLSNKLHNEWLEIANDLEKKMDVYENYWNTEHKKWLGSSSAS